MKKEGLAAFLRALVVTSEVTTELREEAKAQNILIVTFDYVMEQGDAGSPPSFETPTKNDTYILSYTSGTTGDSKGVKLSNNNIVMAARTSLSRLPMRENECVISYLPYTHSFEQILMAFALIQKLRIGFFSGDPTRLVEDCSVLKPDFFPSVPRLYNKIYSKI